MRCRYETATPPPTRPVYVERFPRTRRQTVVVVRRRDVVHFPVRRQSQVADGLKAPDVALDAQGHGLGLELHDDHAVEDD